MFALTTNNGTTRRQLSIADLHSYVLANGADVIVRDLETCEALFFTMDISDTARPYRQGVNKMLAYVEGLNLIAGYTDVDALDLVAPQTTKDFYKANAMSWYADAIAGQMQGIIRTLQGDPNSRKAIAYIGHNRYRPEDQTCCTSVQFVWRDDTLFTIVNMRSLDLYLGLPYDAAMFGMLGQAVRRALGISVGRVYIQATSAHIYMHSYKPKPWSIVDGNWVPTEWQPGPWSSIQRSAEYALREIFESGRVKAKARTR